MSKNENLFHFSDLLLLIVAAIWGSSYGVVKNALVFYPVLGLLALRFGATFVLLLPALASLRRTPAATHYRLLGCGTLLFCIFIGETSGVLFTSASNAAFLISLCVVLTPLVEWALLKRRPQRMEWIATGLSLLGAWLLVGGSFALNKGDALILMAALLRALHVCAVKRTMREAAVSPLAVTAAQAGVVAAGSFAALALLPQAWPPLPSLSGHGEFWGSMIYLILGCTLFAFFVQSYAMRRSSPTRVGLLMGSEPAFGALFAYLWLGERLPVSGWCGGALIVIASILAVIPWKERAVLRPVSSPQTPC